MASRKMDDLDSRFIMQFMNVVGNAKKAGIDLLVYCTYRSGAEQNILYEQGRTAKGRVVTNAKANESPHNCKRRGFPASLAMDVVPLVAGKPLWSQEGEALKVWQAVGALATEQGLLWGGNFTGRLLDFPHIQLLDWKTYHEK